MKKNRGIHAAVGDKRLLGVKGIERIERASLNEDLSRFFHQSDLVGSSLFDDSISTFLLFSYNNITEPHLFHEFVKRCDSPLYVGYLTSMLGQGLGSPDAGCIRVEPDAKIEGLEDAFTRDPGLPAEAAIQYYVTSGFVIAPEPRWAIWFSTYWEIAICGFRAVPDAGEFRDFHKELRFFSNEDVLSLYEANPSSDAISRLSRYLQHNLLEQAR